MEPRGVPLLLSRRPPLFSPAELEISENDWEYGSMCRIVWIKPELFEGLRQTLGI